MPRACAERPRMGRETHAGPNHSLPCFQGPCSEELPQRNPRGQPTVGLKVIPTMLPGLVNAVMLLLRYERPEKGPKKSERIVRVLNALTIALAVLAAGLLLFLVL